MAFVLPATGQIVVFVLPATGQNVALVLPSRRAKYDDSVPGPMQRDWIAKPFCVIRA
ncbi:unnamed protein product [Rhodiola kirilowii]